MPAPANLVHQTSTGVGTADFSLSAVNGKQTFAGAFSANPFWAFVSNRDASDEWEVLNASLSSGLLDRGNATVVASSNVVSGVPQLVSFSAGTKDVTNDIPAEFQVYGSAGGLDNRLVRSDGVSGQQIQATGIAADDSDNLSGIAALAATTVTASGAVSGGSAAGNMVASQSDQETGTSTTTLVPPGRQQFHQSAGKCWIKCDAAGAVNASYNVTSVTDDGTGLVTVTVANDFSSANYAVTVTPYDGTTAAQLRNTVLSAQAAGSFQCKCTNSAGALIDPINWHAMAFGDL